ncbi:MAG: protein kinase [Gemmataceae bacterium]
MNHTQGPPPEVSPDAGTTVPPVNTVEPTLIHASDRSSGSQPPADATKTGPGESPLVFQPQNYRLVRPLGQGGMGSVYLAEDITLGRSVALKVIRPELAKKASMRERFLREARAVAGLRHPNIVPIYLVDEHQGVPFFVMPLLEGVSLEDWLAQFGTTPVPLDRLLPIASGIIAGLRATHAAGLIHRDIKPSNIWLDHSADHAPILLDFGLVRETSSAEVDPLTRPGVLLGTPAYMAPEQARGDTMDFRSDLFSFGVLLYRLATGRLPFSGRDAMSQLLALAMEDPAPPATLNPQLPPDLAALITQLLSKDPSQRPTSTDEVAQRLARLAREERSTVPLEPVPALPRSPRRRWMVALVTLASAGILAVASFIYFQTPHGTLRVEVNAPDIKVSLTGQDLKIQGAGEPMRLRAGLHGLTVQRGDLEFQTKQFTIRKGEVTHLRVDLLQGKVEVRNGDTLLNPPLPPPLPEKAPTFPPLAAPWLEKTQALAPQAALDAVEAELLRRNPDSKPIFAEPPAMHEGQVQRLIVGNLRDLTPLRALPHLTHLKMVEACRLDDLSCLRGMKLTTLEIGHYNSEAGFCQVADLSPLKELPLTSLSLRTNRVVDYRLVRDRDLEHLCLWQVPQGTNLAVLGEIRSLRELHIHFSALTDLRPYRDLKLTRLSVCHCPLSDLTPIASLPLVYLDIGQTKVTNLMPLRALKLESLLMNGATIDREMIKVFRTGNLHHLQLYDCGLTQLEFLRGTNIRSLNLGANSFTDLRPLEGLSLQRLWIDETPVADLTPLRKIATLEELSFPSTQVKSITPLLDLPLKTIWLDYDPLRDAPLRRLRSLEYINDKPAADFWKMQAK